MIHSTVYIERIQQHNKSFERTAINQYFIIMIYDKIINAVIDGAKFTVNYQKRTCRVNGKIIVNDMQYDGCLGT